MSDVRERHHSTLEPSGRVPSVCVTCRTQTGDRVVWPCDAIREADRADAAEARIKDPCLERERDAAEADAERLAAALRQHIETFYTVEDTGYTFLTYTGSPNIKPLLDALAAHDARVKP